MRKLHSTVHEIVCYWNKNIDISIKFNKFSPQLRTENFKINNIHYIQYFYSNFITTINHIHVGGVDTSKSYGNKRQKRLNYNKACNPVTLNVI